MFYILHGVPEVVQGKNLQNSTYKCICKIISISKQERDLNLLDSEGVEKRDYYLCL